MSNRQLLILCEALTQYIENAEDCDYQDDCAQIAQAMLDEFTAAFVRQAEGRDV